MSGHVEGISLTLDSILEKLGKSLSDSKNVVSYDVQDITNGSAFLSNVFKLRFECNQPTDLPSSLILKVPGVANSEKFMKDATPETQEAKEDDGLLDFLQLAHAKEMAFYKKFPAYDASLKLPKYYYGHDYDISHTKGIIIMEDMTPKGTTIPMLPGFSHDQVCALVRALARVHCVSWTNRDWIPEFNQEKPDAEQFIVTIQNMCFALKQIKPEWFSDLTDELLPIITAKEIFQVDQEKTKYGFPCALVHGDLWAPNVLWTKDADGKATDELCAIIDWQIAHSGNPCEDLGRVLSLNVSTDYRRKNTATVLKVYHDAVSEYFKGKPPCTLEQIERAYDFALPSVAAFTAFGAPMYHEMASVVGVPDDESRPVKRLELLDRVRTTFEDALAAWKKTNNS